MRPEWAGRDQSVLPALPRRLAVAAVMPAATVAVVPVPVVPAPVFFPAAVMPVMVAPMALRRRPVPMLRTMFAMKVRLGPRLVPMRRGPVIVMAGDQHYSCANRHTNNDTKINIGSCRCHSKQG